MTSPEPPSPEPASPDAPPRVLLVDDNVDGRRALQKILEMQGFEVADFGEGLAALAALRQGPGFDIVLVDLLLPDLDGREIARAAAKLSPRPLIALITGWGTEAAVDPDAYGIDLVFFKPLDVLDLIEKLRQGRAG